MSAPTTNQSDARAGWLIDVYGGPWRPGTEVRRNDMLAIKSGPYTILTVGDYYDGFEIAARVQFICDAVNEKLAREATP